MCKFCDELFTGDCNASLFTADISAFGISGLLDIDVFITDNILELYIENMDGDTVVKNTRPIKYCPMCGRKLEKEG